jgi:predicted phage gp36 major capsid-like protein
MWTVTILFAGGGSVNLIYEGEGRANGTWETLRTLRNPTEDTYAPTATFNDDFGTSVTIDIAEVVCHTLQEIRKAQAGNGELQLANMRAQMETQQKVQRDPALRMMMRPPGGGLVS